jgi:hypothetical protein
MHKRILLALALAVLLAGAQLVARVDAQVVTEEPFGEVDWCYEFNFITNDHESQILIGEWESGTGIKSELANGTQSILMLLQYPLTVQPLGVVWRFDRGFGTGPAPVDVQASLNAFGIGHTPDPIQFQISPDWSPEDQFALVALTSQSAGQSGTTAQVSLNASNNVNLTSLVVYGNGVNPFPFNHCGAATTTPTQTATEPGTPTATATQGACLLPGQPSPTPGAPTSTPTVGPSPTPQTFMFTDDFSGDLPFGVTRTLGVTGPMNGGSISIWSSGLEGWNTSTDYPSSVSSKWYNPGPATVYHDVFYTFPANVVVTAVHFDVMAIGYGSGGYTAYAAAYQEGLALDPAHPTGYIAGNQGASGAGHEYVWETKTFPHTGYLLRTVEVRLASTRGASWSLNAIDNVEIYFKWVTPPATTPTPWPECTLTPTVTPSVSPTPSASPTPFTLTPTFTRTPTVTPFPIVIPTTAPTNTPRPTNTAGPPTATLDPSVTPTLRPGYNEGTVGPFVPPESGNGGQGSGLHGLGNALIAFGANAWQRASGWASNAAGTITRLTNAWRSAAPTPLPYMPQCRTNPLANELCAIWYILTFTVFSGTLGSLIVPMGVAVIDIYFLFVFIRMARAVIAQIKQMRS